MGITCKLRIYGWKDCGVQTKGRFKLVPWPPPPGVLKINVDGAFSSSRGNAAFGVIARDSSGTAQFWRCGKVKVSLACAIEASALWIACNSVIEADYSQVIFESDSQVVIQSGQGRINCPWEIQTVVEDIKTWAKGRN
ncbi:hypothetical protein RHMOL_Rhmol08G0194800 [Rhododendron molle]|uniref:Uncharacterized protein n=1 Tax=Rhododendron molle TaxID=49168 RepID=A0ACC0MRG5_RHOML|nr:hypothetical protein RHMOL_Rhmol08G0194800 [Rhododendron molle]